MQMVCSHEGSLFTYALSFSLLLALAPSLLLFVMLFADMVLNLELLASLVMRFIPSADEALIKDIFQYFAARQYSLLSYVSTMIASFYLASRSIYSFLLISARNEEITLPGWLLRIRSLILFAALAGYVVFSISLLNIFSDFFPYVSALLLFVFFYLMYHVLSFRRRTLYFGIIGALASTTCMMILSTLFLFVIQYFTSYQAVYGPLASMVILFLAIYLISCIIYIGFCLNHVWAAHLPVMSLPLKHAKAYRLILRFSESVRQKLEKKRNSE